MTPFNQFLKGDVIDVLRTLDADSVDFMATSPPYWALRNYGVLGQFGLEKTPQEYIERMVKGVMGQMKRVLKPTGVMFVNLGDTYNGTKVGNTNGTQKGVRQKAGVNEMQFVKSNQANLPPKSLIGIPSRFMIAMIDDGWICRNNIIWYKRNAMPQSAKDRFSVDYENIFMFTKEARPLFYINELSGQLIKSKPPTIKNGIEGKDWYWLQVYPKEEAEEDDESQREGLPKAKRRKAVKGEDIGRPAGTFWRQTSLWYGQSYYFKTQYRPLSESTIAEIQKAYNGKSRKDYAGAMAQDASDSKRSMIKSLNPAMFATQPIEELAEGMGINTGIKFGGNKAEGYGNPTYSGKPWVPTVASPEIIKEFTIDTRPGRDTGNGKSGTPEDPNAGLHNSDLSTKRQTTIREINGELFVGLKRSVWDITTRGYPGAHFATFPEVLVEQMIKPGCPEWVCVACGVPRFPIYQPSPEYAKLLGKGWHDHSADAEKGQMQDKHLPSARADYRVVGLSDCGCGAGFRPGLALDPFSGAGTVALVALKLGFNFLGIELKQEYIDQSIKRLNDNGFNYAL